VIDNTKTMMGKDEDGEEAGEEEEVGIDRMDIDLGAGIERAIEEEEIEEIGVTEETEEDIEIGNKEAKEEKEEKEVDIEVIEAIEVIEGIGVIEGIEEIEGIGEVEAEEIKAKDVFITISKQEDFLIIKRKSKHNCSPRNKVNFLLIQDNIPRNKLKEEECN
jgi:hypothetical protein